MSTPQVSGLVNENEYSVSRTFGNTWRERVDAVRGFCIRTAPTGQRSTGINDIENLFDFALCNVHRLHADRNTHYFLLLADERVVQVDVYAKGKRGESPGHVYALRFRTNKRVSEWFGDCVGAMTRFQSPDGCYIRALYGSVHASGCGQVGVVYGSLVPQESVVSDDDVALTNSVHSGSAANASFRVMCEKPRAFVVGVGSVSCNVAVVSEAQYEKVVQLDPPSNHGSEHWFVLADDEHVTSVGVGVDRGKFVAVRFRTNLRTSIWFGSQASKVAWLECPRGAFICGFQINGWGTTSCLQVKGLAAVYKVQEGASGKEKVAPKSSETKPTASVDHASEAA